MRALAGGGRAGLTSVLGPRLTAGLAAELPPRLDADSECCERWTVPHVERHQSFTRGRYGASQAAITSDAGMHSLLPNSMLRWQVSVLLPCQPTWRIRSAMLVATVLRSSRRPDGSSGTTACVQAASTLAPRSFSGDSCGGSQRGAMDKQACAMPLSARTPL